MVLAAAKGGDLLFLLLIIIVSIVFSSLISAITLRISQKILKFEIMAFGKSFLYSLLVNSIGIWIGYSIGLQGFISNSLNGRSHYNQHINLFPSSSTFLIYLVALCLLMNCAIYRRLFSNENHTISFNDSFALSSVWCGLTSAVGTIIAVVYLASKLLVGS
jgi:hypothetical protein